MNLVPPPKGTSVLSANLSELERKKVPYVSRVAEDGKILVSVPLYRLTMTYSPEGVYESSFGGTSV